MKKLFLFFLVWIGGVLLTVGAEIISPPNILFISVDDMNNDLGCYGNSQVKSPNIDRLAKKGVRFDKAYCQFPLCSPSRTSLMTGLRPATTKVFDLKTHFRTTIPQTVTLSQLFRTNGYFAARVGKIYHYGNPTEIGTSGLDDAVSWDTVANPAGRDKTILQPDIINYTPKRGLGSGMCWYSDKEGRDEEHTDGMVATEIIRLLEEKRDQPFFIAAGFYKPHTPYVAPEKYFQLYPLEKIRIPPINSVASKAVPQNSLDSTRPWPWFGVNEDQARQCKQAFYATISFVDAQIGRVLDAMDRLDLWKNTIVVFWSDHGYHLGEHGLWMKQSLYEESARVPLIIVAPRAKGNGRSSSRLVELVDLYPTLADLAGIALRDKVHGVSLRPLLKDPAQKWDRPAFTEVRRGNAPGFSVRTERWTYIEWDLGRKGIQLYDRRKDPEEMNNKGDVTKHAQIIQELKEQIRQNWAGDYATLDQ